MVETENGAPIVHAVRVSYGAAGMVSATADVQYPGEETKPCTFAGMVYGGPVAYTFPSAVPAVGTVSGFVAQPERFGVFGDGPEEWVRRFYA